MGKLMLYADTRLGGVSRLVYGDPDEEDMRVPKELIDCVCYVCTNVNGEWRYGGTAFFIAYPNYRYHFEHLYVVTARHSIETIRRLGGDVCLRINTRDGGAEIMTTNKGWVYPDSPSVDLAILPLDLPRDSRFQFKSVPFTDIIDDDPFPLRDMGPGEELIVTGLFSMHYGSQRNYPIVRSGILAAMPDEPLTDEKSKKEYAAYLIEVRSIGGLSGSPVFMVYRSPAPRTPPEISYPSMRREVRSYYLLGIIRGHWDIKRGPLVPVFDNDQEHVNMGIAVVTPAAEIRQMLLSDAFKEARQEKESERAAKNGPTPD